MTLYDRYVRRLTIGEKERYYADTTVVARMLGATDAVIPPTLAEYRLFLHERLAGPGLTVTEPAREIARAILDGPLPLRFRPIARVNRLAAAGVLPPRLRREYGLGWTPAHNLALVASAGSLRALGMPFVLAAGRVPQPRLAARA
jgi:uncharacterized protein (DUF2236 family)